MGQLTVGWRGGYNAEMSQPSLVLGTRNQHKVLELRELLDPLGIAVRSLAEFPEAVEVVEDGATFAANAAQKAAEQAQALRRWVLAEDSGLCVDALGGAPGVYSARYAGESCDDQANNQKLLAELTDVPLERRIAHYVCSAALADPQGAIQATSEAYCRGRILLAPAGVGGFGYDPLFEIPEYHLTFGQLGPAVKAVISHRARAMRRIVADIERFVKLNP